MVEVLVNLLGVAILAQEAAQDAQAPHPKHLCGQACLPGTPALTCKFGVGDMGIRNSLRQRDETCFLKTLLRVRKKTGICREKQTKARRIGNSGSE